MKGKNYSFLENCYIEKNYPYIPIAIECKYKYYDAASKLELDSTIGIYDISENKDYIKAYCLNKDLNRVSTILKLEYDVTGKESNEYLDWLHDGLYDDFSDMEVDNKDYASHCVIHYILDNIDRYCGYFIKADCDYEWLYSLYDDAKDGIVDGKYLIK